MIHSNSIFILLSICCLLATVSGFEWVSKGMCMNNMFNPNGKCLVMNKKGTSLNLFNPNFNYLEVYNVNATDADIPFKGELKTGYIDVLDGKSKLFYEVYAAGGANNSGASLNNSAPLILWLQGGPGCADGTGNYNEIGPVKIIKDERGWYIPVPRQIHWNDEYNLLFVDSPIGVGYSVTSGHLTSTAWETAQHLEKFLVRFFQLYPNLRKNDLHIFGESYGGHYVPALGTIIVQNHATNQINLKGVAVGNGCTDPKRQVSSFADLTLSLGLADEALYVKLLETGQRAQQYIDKGNQNMGTYLWNVANGYIIKANNHVNTYNFEQYKTDPNENNYIRWLNLGSVKKALGVDPKIYYLDCSGEYYGNFIDDISTSYSTNYSFLLTQTTIPNLKVMVYGGQNDIVCNNLGVARYLKDLPWEGRDGFYHAKKQILKTPSGNVVGTYRHYKNLNFAILFGAGHEAPMEEPEASRLLLEYYMKDKFQTNATISE